MKIIADLHIHSPYSRATSPHLTPPALERWARIKGISLLGTGDCTHPQWLKELREQTEDAEEGFYVLKKQVRDSFDAGPAMVEGLPLPGLPAGLSIVAPQTPRFVLTGEISTIYKREDKTRKIHHLIILPDFKAAAVFNARLEAWGGNIRSDGRPIFGMDSRDLLGLLLEADERSLLIPAHIWTPWFSALGAKSGFDSIEECYGDLTGHIPAIETGLSSNPPMNWALNSLDKFSIISNSDAHSPDKLGREATILEMDLSYSSFRSALIQQPPSPSPAILGTIEFFPQEGKYHYDGHRKCGLSLGPEEAAEANYLCPVCGRALTPGVMSRVLELADRPVNETEPCPGDYWGTRRRPYHSLIPLKEIVGELLGTGPASKKNLAAYYRLIEKGGSEFSILLDMSKEELEKLKIPELPGELLAQAIVKMRSGEVSVSPGYDGEYGRIRVFGPGSVPALKGAGEKGLFEETPHKGESVKKAEITTGGTWQKKEKKNTEVRGIEPQSFAWDADQEKAVSYNGKECIIIAGPGTGKTAVLTARIERLIGEGVDPASILALAFTVRAAGELRKRINRIHESEAPAMLTATTFHSFCCSVLRKQGAQAGLNPEFMILGEAERDSLLREIGGRQAQRLGFYIEERKRFLMLPGEEFPQFLNPEKAHAPFPLALEQWGIPEREPEMEALYEEYRKALKSSHSLDFEDLTAGTVRLLASYPAILDLYRGSFRHVLVDEYQDINFSQYALIRLLAPGGKAGGGDSPSLCVIGDPNQAIYGFRGSDKRFIDRFLLDYPEAGCFELSRSFRCAAPIIKAAGRLTGTNLRLRGNEETSEVSLYRKQYTSDKSEAEGIARTIAALLGGTSFFALDSGAAENPSLYLPGKGSFGPGDCVVLVRAAALAPPIVKALKDHDIPYELSGENPWWKEEPTGALLDALRAHALIERLRKPGKPEKAGGDQAALNPGDSIRSAWEELAGKEKAGQKKKAAEIVERLISLADLFGDLSTLLDTLDACAAFPEHLGQAQVRAMNAVTVMTIHASKGLEAEFVFVAGLEEGILPFTLFDKPGEAGNGVHGGSTAGAERLEEERRLLYVAMTRAKRGLWLSWAQSRIFRGRKLNGAPSRFLSELEKLIPLAREEKTRKWDGQRSLF